MQLNQEAFVSEVVAMCVRVIADYEPSLLAVGLIADAPELSRAGKRVEVAFSVRHEGDIEDVIEFAVIQNGRASCSIAALEEWLRGALSDVIRRAGEGS